MRCDAMCCVMPVFCVTCIAQLPPSFAALEDLEELSAEGCPMRIPGPDIILRGPEYVRRWCANSTESTVFRTRQRT